MPAAGGQRTIDDDLRAFEFFQRTTLLQRRLDVNRVGEWLFDRLRLAFFRPDFDDVFGGGRGVGLRARGDLLR